MADVQQESGMAGGAPLYSSVKSEPQTCRLLTEDTGHTSQCQTQIVLSGCPGTQRKVWALPPAGSQAS